MKRLFILLSLLTSTISANPFGTAWLQTFGKLYRERFAIKEKGDTVFNPVVKHVLSASASTIIKLTQLPEKIERSTDFPEEIARPVIDLLIPEIYGTIADTLVPIITEKDQLAGAPTGMQRFAELSSAAHKKHESKFLQSIISISMHSLVSIIAKPYIEDVKKRMGIDKSAWECPCDYLYNQIVFGATKKCGEALDHWLRPVSEKDLTKKLECSACAHEISELVPSKDSPEGKAWRKRHLCKEDWKEISEASAARCEKHSI
ncbi:TPA: hypothetical protein DIC20_02285 [Candidatus Dependentiae bacterium]|nr:MAG: hypothetical protein US03_C0003G0016 [candidate division TM6 bacterium GW2011_GWF2_36_131]KKQ03335.1 MAG: hypothetical protein US13_C0003G0016 [candidate division TM6 bacterium GW2011_GWE2_36_25]KKQ19731.1 MAG: hypothetical protein US32_C0005G0015 [candidate division TM6 bacterium GW2011_GWA2_36_9]HBR70887.1 hypothetical protein [Candidatus Dependentiae bacterium]HCU00510.1 hypothetical protein [Candidatus Dependentiae bacterium]